MLIQIVSFAAMVCILYGIGSFENERKSYILLAVGFCVFAYMGATQRYKGVENMVVLAVFAFAKALPKKKEIL
jgi:hypothetical protein